MRRPAAHSHDSRAPHPRHICWSESSRSPPSSSSSEKTRMNQRSPDSALPSAPALYPLNKAIFLNYSYF